jgi:carboxypeptidase C (cathepsin A)
MTPKGDAMRRSPLTALPLAVLLAGALAAPSLAQEPMAGAETAKKEEKVPPPKPLEVVTHHRLQSGATDLRYTATAEEIYLHDAEGEPTASFFTISYVLEGTEKPEERPVTFVFNGGPGSSSIWLHFGLVGPKTVDIPSDASDPGAPPYRLRDNPATILRATDLVFVDPVGTGFSHALGEKKDEDFWGYEEDADSVAELIRTFITRHERWNSPKFILGESYGGIRTGMLVPRLQQDLSIGLNGLILISPALNMGTLPFDVSGNDLPYVTHLPAYAATAYYHHKLPDEWPSLEALLDEVEAYAGGDYLAALFRGDTLTAEERERVAERLHRYTGLSKDYLLRTDLRVYAIRFIKELLRDEGLVVGLLDGRYVQDELDDAGEFPDGDPFSAKTSPIYVATFHDYLRHDLGVDLDRRFLPQSNEANQHWKRPGNRNHAFAGYVDVTGPMAQGTKDNGELRVFAAGGYHDLTTSYFATQYMLRHSGIDPDRLTLKTYEGGHMMYLYRPSLEALSDDVVAFIEAR